MNPSENVAPFYSGFFSGVTSPLVISQYDVVNNSIQFQAVNLSPHLCARYQTDIKGINSCFGIPGNDGTTKSVIFVTNDGLYFHKMTTMWFLCLILFRHYRNEESGPSRKRMNSRPFSCYRIIVFPEKPRTYELK